MAYLVVTIDSQGLTSGSLKDKGLELGNAVKSLSGIVDFLDGIKSGSFSADVKVEVQDELTEDTITEGYYTQVEVEAYGLSISGRDSETVIDTPAAASQFDGQVAGMTTDVTIDADVVGIAGDVTLTADSIKDIDTLISDWNIAEPTNTLTLTVGDGSQVPTVDVVLSGGVDEVSHLEYFVNGNNPVSETFNLR